jgi:hypothetical protein
MRRLIAFALLVLCSGCAADTGERGPGGVPPKPDFIGETTPQFFAKDNEAAPSLPGK